MEPALILIVLVFHITTSRASSVNFTSVDFFQSMSNDCTVKAKCEPVFNTTCLGTTISHLYTSHVLANDSHSLADIHDKLTMWHGLQYVPKCWEVVQAFLCAVYMPKCENGLVELPTHDMCYITRRPCKIVELETGWPEFLQCEEDNGVPRFPSTCSTENVYKKVQFNTTGECESPLVATDNERSWYDNVEGCGIQCRNPLYTDDQHSTVHIFIGVFAGICLISTCFTLMTFAVDWKNSAKYPALILFYMNGCFFVGSIGFLAQFATGAREDITCRKDGTMRLGEPSEGENLSCVIVFVIVYYFIIAGCIWFVNLALAWHLSFRALGTPRDVLHGLTAYMHMAAWTIPLVCVVIILARNEVDGDSVAGICFVGYQNHYYRAGFVLLPLGAMLLVGGFFLVNGLVTLCNLERDNPGLLNDKAVSRIKGTIARIGLFATLAFAFVFITFACHVYEFTHQAQWEKGFQEYLVCEANVTILSGSNSDGPLPSCSIQSRPSLSVVLIHLFSMFGAGIAMSMWVWTASTIAIWKRFWRKITRQPINEPLKLKKSRMIAKAFAKKKGTAARMEEHERLSVSFEEVSHDDAIGMKLDLPSKSSFGSSDSSVFRGNEVPSKLLSRRGAACVLNKSRPGSRDSPNSIEADVIIEPPPRNRRKNNNRSKHRSRNSGKFEQAKQTNKQTTRNRKPVTMAFIEEEDEEAIAKMEEEEEYKMAMARYEEEEEEEHKQIVNFMQGFRKSRENSPEDFQFMPGQMEEPELSNEHNDMILESLELQQQAPTYKRFLVNPNGIVQDNPKRIAQDFPMDYIRDYPQQNCLQKNCPCSCTQGYSQDYLNCNGHVNSLHSGQKGSHLVQNGSHLVQNGSHQVQNGSHLVQKGSHLVQNSSHLVQKGSHLVQKGSHQVQKEPSQIASPVHGHQSHNVNVTHTQWENIQRDFSDGSITPASTQGSSSEYYYESTDDDVELPPHLCGSVTPEERHTFGPVKTGPHSIAARRRAPPINGGARQPMGHNIPMNQFVMPMAYGPGGQPLGMPMAYPGGQAVGMPMGQPGGQAVGMPMGQPGGQQPVSYMFDSVL